MRKGKILLAVISIFILIIFSCSKDNGDNKKLIKKLVETSSDGKLNTTLFTYNENEIEKSESDQKRIEYTYKDGLITKIVTKDKATKLSVSLEFTYDNDKLVIVKSSDNYVLKFTHNTDETVSYQKTTLNSQKEEVKLYHGVLYFKNKNLIKDKRILDDSAVGIVSTYNVNYDYDDKINPFYNILGFDKLLNINDIISLNNSQIIVVESNVTNALDQIISSANFYKSIFIYDKQGYPSKKVSEDVMPVDGKSGYLDIQYFYE